MPTRVDVYLFVYSTSVIHAGSSGGRMLSLNRKVARNKRESPNSSPKVTPVVRYIRISKQLIRFNCSSGNASPLADNAIWVTRAIEQFRVRAAGSSHEVNRELSRMHPRCGRFRVKRDACVSCGHPSSNLGRNLFPPRRFSYYTRFSRFNGTAKQPSHDNG
jgi:ribosomal protein L37E